jgi:hypothetical protein
MVSYHPLVRRSQWPDRTPRCASERAEEDLEGGQSPWKDRAFGGRKRLRNATDSSAEQGLEVGRSSGHRRNRRRSRRSPEPFVARDPRGSSVTGPAGATREGGGGHRVTGVQLVAERDARRFTTLLSQATSSRCAPEQASRRSQRANRRSGSLWVCRRPHGGRCRATRHPPSDPGRYARVSR